MQPLSPPDAHHLKAAQGWLELGNHLEANEESEKIAPTLRTRSDVLEIRWQIYAKEKKWEACVDIAEALVKLAPKRAESWIHRSYALHELKRTKEAFDNLVQVADTFPKLYTVPYNLACYCAQLGQLKEAEDWFKKAILIDDKQVPKLGIEDPDLKPLWDSMSMTIWKKTE